MSGIGRVIRKIREKKEMAQSELAKLAGLKQPNLSRIETGYIVPKESTLRKIADAFGIPPEELKQTASRLAPAGNLGRPIRTVPVVVFDTSAGYEIDFDDGGHPIGHSDMTIRVPAIGAPVFAARVYGDSMEASEGGHSFRHGDIVVFAERAVSPGDFAFVRTKDFSTFKQVFFDEERVRLVPLNRAYQERVVPRGEIIQMWKMVQHVRLYE